MDKSSEDNDQELQIKFPDELIGGAYANNMIIAHTKEEFVMDFIMAAPPAGTVTSRLIISPGHVKRILNAIADNIEKYEQTYGVIEEASEPNDEGEFYKH
jgi:hypothetical protein